MNKKEENLIEKFKKIETELLQVLSETQVEADLSQNSKVVKSQLKAFTKKVDKARKLFDEYEQIAQKIEDLTTSETQDATEEIAKNSIADAVVNLRDANDFNEYQDSIEVINGESKVTKKKKNKSSAREF